MFASRIIKVVIARPFAEVYDFLAEPRNFASWATMPGGRIQSLGDGDWLAEMPDSRLVMRFSPRNPYGVLDYHASPEGAPRGPVVPVRLYPNDEGCELLYTVFRRAGVTDERFASDAEWITSDLERLKSLLEAG